MVYLIVNQNIDYFSAFASQKKDAHNNQGRLTVNAASTSFSTIRRHGVLITVENHHLAVDNDVDIAKRRIFAKLIHILC